jgi:hypothetical protein
MFERQKIETHACPNCGKELHVEHGELRCADHGTFFAYGPNLVVRAAIQPEQLLDVQMPWEQAFAK